MLNNYQRVKGLVNSGGARQVPPGRVPPIRGFGGLKAIHKGVIGGLPPIGQKK